MEHVSQAMDELRKALETAKPLDVELKETQPTPVEAVIKSVQDLIATPPPKPKHAGGRPSLYKESYPQMLYDYFNITPTYEKVTKTKSKGVEKVTKKILANDLPTLAGFAWKIGVSRETLYEWGRVHPEFSDVLSRVKDSQEHILVTNSLQGRYNSTYASLASKVFLGWKERSEINTTTVDLGDLLKQHEQKKLQAPDAINVTPTNHGTDPEASG